MLLGKRVCTVLLAYIAITFDGGFAASTQKQGNIVCEAPSGTSVISTICCADLPSSEGSDPHHFCTTLSNDSGNLRVIGKLNSAGDVLESQIKSNGSTCGSVHSTPADEACFDVTTYDANEVCFRLSVKGQSETSESSPVCLALPSLNSEASRRQKSILSDLLDGLGPQLAFLSYITGNNNP